MLTVNRMNIPFTEPSAERLLPVDAMTATPLQELLGISQQEALLGTMLDVI